MSEAVRKIVDSDSVRPYRSPKQRRQTSIAVVVVLLVAGLGAGGYFLLAPRQETYVLRGYESATVTQGNMVQSTQASGSVALPTQMSLTSPESGYALSLAVAEGDTVRKGQVLATISVPDLEDDLEDLKTSAQNAKNSYERTVAQHAITRQRAQREIESLASDIQDATAERDRVERLVAVNASRKSELEAAQTSLDKLLAQKTEKELQLGEDKTLHELDEQASLATIQDLNTRIRRLQERIADATIRAPMDGEVLEVSSLLGVPGSLVAGGAAIFTIADPASAMAEVEVLEQYSGVLTVGQTVKLTVGSSTLQGVIVSIGKVAQQSSDGLGATVAVRVKPVSSEVRLILGNTVVAEIGLDAKEGVLLLPRGPYLTTGSQRYVYRVDGDVARRVTVTFGSTTGSSVEILSGVEAGDEIITSGYQNYIEYEQIALQKGD